jgi:hypothetical protein
MRLTVQGADGRCHVDHPQDQLGLVDVWSLAVAAVELGAGEAIA